MTRRGAAPDGRHRMRSFAEIMQAVCRRAPSYIGVPKPEEDVTLAAVAEAARVGLGIPILVGDREAIKDTAEQSRVDVSDFEIIPEPDPARACAAAVALVGEGRARCGPPSKCVARATSCAC